MPSTFSVHPHPPTSTRGQQATVAIAAPTTSVSSHRDLHIYEVALVGPLPVINVTRTLAAKLCGRTDDVAFNECIIRFTQRADPFIHALAPVILGTGLTLMFIADMTIRKTMTLINAILGVSIVMHGFASLSWDMLMLVLGTFEFWFLYGTNATNMLWFSMLFHDERVAVFVVTGSTLVLSLCADANIYTRRFVTRLVVVLSPGLVIALTTAVLNIPPDLHYVTFTIFELRIDMISLAVNNGLIVGYFMAIRILRSRHLVFTTGPIERIACEFYFPVCHLVLHAQRCSIAQALARTDIVTTSSKTPTPLHTTGILNSRQQLELIDCTETMQSINADEVVLPRLVKSIARWQRSSVLNCIGIAGLTSSTAALLWSVIAITPMTSDESPTTHVFVFVLAASGLSTSLIFTLLYAAHLQRTLAYQICHELDAWFVSLQLSLVTVATCDLLAWNPHRVPLIVTAWVWGHWLIFLDAVPPVTRHRLAYDTRLTLAVTAALLAYPLALAYWLYFSRMRTIIHNRVIIDTSLGGVRVYGDVLGFLASKLFTLLVWMGRFLYRELRRPQNAFKLIKRRVFYRVHV